MGKPMSPNGSEALGDQNRPPKVAEPIVASEAATPKPPRNKEDHVDCKVPTEEESHIRAVRPDAAVASEAITTTENEHQPTPSACGWFWGGPSSRTILCVSRENDGQQFPC